MKQSVKRMLLPSLVFFFAMGLAFATVETSEMSVNPEPINGYIDNSQPCTQQVDCLTEGVDICTSGEQQAKAFNLAGTSCDVKVYRVEP